MKVGRNHRVLGPRPLVVLVLSVAAVVAPAAGAAVAGTLVRRGLASGAATTEPAAALLVLASAALTLVLLWATLAVAAGVRQGWHDAHRPRTTVGPSPTARSTASAGTVPPGAAAYRSRRRPDLVAATVAGLVVAALTAPAASAGTPAPAPAALHTGAELPAPDATAATSPGPSGPADPLPGSWSGLADDGFRAPGGVSSTTTSLVTGRPARTVDARHEVVVVAGDSLWSIAARHLGDEADDAQVAAAWPGWWQANRSTIGDDPHLILPGQRLQVPAG